MVGYYVQCFWCALMKQNMKLDDLSFPFLSIISVIFCFISKVHHWQHCINGKLIHIIPNLFLIWGEGEAYCGQMFVTALTVQEYCFHHIGTSQLMSLHINFLGFTWLEHWLTWNFWILQKSNITEPPLRWICY